MKMFVWFLGSEKTQDVLCYSSMRKQHTRLFAVALAAVAFLAWNTSSLQAQTTELPPGVFHMADGVYYHPKSGAKSLDLSIVLTAYQTFLEQQTAPSAQTTGTVPEVSEQASFPLLQAIERAHTLLREVSDTTLTAETIPTWRRIRLVVWDPSTDVLRVVDAEKNEKQLRQLSGDGTVKVLRANGLNSTFHVVSDRAGELVVAIRYPIYRERADGSYTVEQAIYTPYNSAFNSDQMTAAGESWLAQIITDAEKELSVANVFSRAYPDRLLSEVIDPAFVASILTIEHVDFTAAKKDVHAQIGAFYAILATNKEDSYAFSRSSAGALGIAQFIPSTYAWLAAQPTLGLVPDFDAGMTDPKNAVKAQIAYLDYLLSLLPKEARDAYLLPEHRLLVQEYIAAAYNGGPAKVKKAMVVWDENLDAEERLRVRTRSRLKLETMYYVWKLRLVRPVLMERFTALEKA